MTMLFARASVPMWLVVLGLGAFFAPAGIATTVLLVLLCLVCIPAVISAGFWKRTVRDSTADAANVRQTARPQGEIIDAEFEAHDVTPKEAKNHEEPSGDR